MEKQAEAISKGLTADISPSILVALYEIMLRIRRFEEKIVEVYPEQEMRCPTHLSIGQEAAAVGVCAALRHRLIDQSASVHRGEPGERRGRGQRHQQIGFGGKC